MSTTTAVDGSFSPISRGPIRTDGRFDLQNLTAEEREVVTADEFIIFGKASIEQWNDPGPGEEHLYIEMDALEGRLEQLLALDNLSRRHDDTKVGEFRDSYTLDKATTLHLDDDETLKFDAGDTLETGVIREGEPLPDGSGPAEEDALWLVANVYGKNDVEGSILSEETRLGSYYGHLDGFSVTVYTREYDRVEKGKVASEVDFLAVTIGEDELIKNKGSHYGVAEFQALFGGTAVSQADDAVSPTIGRAEDLADGIRGRFTVSIFQHLFSQSKEGLVGETIQVAQQSELSLNEAAADVVGDDGDADHIATQAEQKLESIHDRLDQEAADRENLAADVADELGMDKEEVMAMFDELEASTSGDAGAGGDGGSNDGGDGGDGATPGEEQAIDEEALVDEIMNGLPDDANVGRDDVLGAVQGAEAEAEAQTSEGTPLEETIQQAAAGAVEERLDDLEVQSGDGGAEYVTEEEFNNRLNELSQQLEDAVDGVGEAVAENVSQQMQTAGTPDPAGGSATAESDIKEEVDGVVESMTFGSGSGGD